MLMCDTSLESSAQALLIVNKKIGLIRFTFDPLSVLGLTYVYLSFSLFSVLRPDWIELDFKEISYLVS